METLITTLFPRTIKKIVEKEKGINRKKLVGKITSEHMELMYPNKDVQDERQGRISDARIKGAISNKDIQHLLKHECILLILKVKQMVLEHE